MSWKEGLYKYYTVYTESLSLHSFKRLVRTDGCFFTLGTVTTAKLFSDTLGAKNGAPLVLP